jgi:hypothetical protein
MKATMFVSIVFLAAASISLQSAMLARKSPRDVVAEYCTMEKQGVRLTPDGWSKTNNFPIPESTVKFMSLRTRTTTR